VLISFKKHASSLKDKPVRQNDFDNRSIPKTRTERNYKYTTFEAFASDDSEFSNASDPQQVENPKPIRAGYRL
jgi:hypothetical protein